MIYSIREFIIFLAEFPSPQNRFTAVSHIEFKKMKTREFREKVTFRPQKRLSFSKNAHISGEVLKKASETSITSENVMILAASI